MAACLVEQHQSRAGLVHEKPSSDSTLIIGDLDGASANDVLFSSGPQGPARRDDADKEEQGLEVGGSNDGAHRHRAVSWWGFSSEIGAGDGPSHRFSRRRSAVSRQTEAGRSVATQPRASFETETRTELVTGDDRPATHEVGPPVVGATIARERSSPRWAGLTAWPCSTPSPAMRSRGHRRGRPQCRRRGGSRGQRSSGADRGCGP